jgi:hypothetical protein
MVSTECRERCGDAVVVDVEIRSRVARAGTVPG